MEEPIVTQTENRLKKLFNPKIIFLFLGIILLVVGFFSVRDLLTSNQNVTPREITPVGNGKIILVARKKEYQVGEVVPVAVRISTGGRSVEGADVVAKYDPNVLEATTSGVMKGKIFGDYPSIQTDQKNGTVRISGITATGQPAFNGSGLLAFVYFKAKAPGQVKISVESTPGNTNDSNLVGPDSAEDILGEVVNLDLMVK